MIDDRLDPPGRRRDDRVAVAARVRGRQRPRDGRRGLRGTRRSTRPCRAPRSSRRRRSWCSRPRALLHRRRRWRRRPIRLAAIVDVSHRVHGDEGAHDEIAVAHGRAAEAPRTGVLATAPLPDGRAGAGADATDLHRTAPRLGAGCVALDRPGRTCGSPTRRSKSAIVTTIGTGPAPVANPEPCSAHQRITPSAEASPKRTRRSATRRRAGRPALGREQIELRGVAGAPPRTSPNAPCLRGTGSPCIRSAPRGASSDRHAPLECR